MASEYGVCLRCQVDIKPVWFKDKEIKNGIPTGRTRMACSHLECPICLEIITVDDTFDGPWK